MDLFSNIFDLFLPLMVVHRIITIPNNKDESNKTSMTNTIGVNDVSKSRFQRAHYEC